MYHSVCVIQYGLICNCRHFTSESWISKWFSKHLLLSYRYQAYHDYCSWLLRTLNSELLFAYNLVNDWIPLYITIEYDWMEFIWISKEQRLYYLKIYVNAYGYSSLIQWECRTLNFVTFLLFRWVVIIYTV